MPEVNENMDQNENARVRLEKKILEEAIQNPGNEFPELAEEHQNMVQSLKNLIAETDKLYTRDQDGNYPKLDKDVQNNMIDLYRGTIDNIEKYRKGVEKSGEKDFRKKNLVGEPLVKLLDKVEKVIGGDLRVLLSATRHGIKTFPDVVRYARTHKVKLGNQNTAKAGANMSSRIRMKVPGPDGQMIEGFFTPSKGKLPGFKAEKDAAFEKLRIRAWNIADVETLESIVNQMKSYFSQNKKVDLEEICDAAYFGERDEDGKILCAPDRVIKKCIDAVKNSPQEELPIDGGDEITDKMFDGTGLGQMIADYLMEVDRLDNKYGILEENVQLDSTDKMERRNSAMSDIAKLLDMENLIAYSEDMVIEQGDQIISGTFMESAKGEDSSLPNMNSVFADPKAIMLVNHPKLKEQLADLQVLDFICGNIDRHMGNMFYQFDKTNPRFPICTGIQGIDNDASFGKIRNGINRLPRVEEMQFISAKTALLVNNLSPAVMKSVLMDYNLSEKEINAATWRAEKIREAIKDKKLKVVAENEWEALNTSNQKNGYFANMRALSKYSGVYLQEEMREDARKYYKKNFMNAYNLRKPINNMKRLLERADKGVWFGSKEYENTRKSFEELVKSYEEGMKAPTADNFFKIQKRIEDVMKNANSYKELKASKTLNEKEKRRLHVVEQILELGETQFHAIGMMQQSCMRMNELEKWREKSFDGIVADYESAMRENVDRLSGAEKEKGELALKSLSALAEMAKSNISPDVDTQSRVSIHMATILNYDPSLMNKTELTYLFSMEGNHGQKKSLESGRDIAGFLNDVYLSEKTKAVIARMKDHQESMTNNEKSAKNNTKASGKSKSGKEKSSAPQM